MDGDPLPACPKCRRPMAIGFVRDLVEGGVAAAAWAEGLPDEPKDLEVPGRRYLPIRALRCTGCGYLEFYAREPLSKAAGMK